MEALAKHLVQFSRVVGKGVPRSTYNWVYEVTRRQVVGTHCAIAPCPFNAPAVLHFNNILHVIRDDISNWWPAEDDGADNWEKFSVAARFMLLVSIFF